VRVAIYVRVSTDEQARHGYSLDHQESECRRVSVTRDWEIGGVFRDEGYSGGSLDRPGLKSLLHEVQSRRVDVVLVWKTDRLSRWLPHIVDIVLAKLPAYGVAFLSATEPYETTTPAGRMFFSQLAAFADFERSMIMERTASGRRAAALAGRWATGAAPYGYALVGEKGRRQLAVVEDEAAVVKRVFAQRLAGASIRGIARALNRSSIPAPRGETWSPQTVRRVLGNPVYTGQAVWGRYRGSGRGRRAMTRDEWLVVPEARHEPVVSVETWEQA
jgi:site-specific DNA recombinase